MQRILDQIGARDRARLPPRLRRGQPPGPRAPRAGVRQPRAAGQQRPDSREQPANSARFTFPDPAAADFYPDWQRVASELVAHLRSAAGRNPYDRLLSDLVGELSTRSDEFRVRWAAHDVRFHRTGTKRIHHPVVGALDLSYETMELSADEGPSVAVFTAEPGSPSQEALDLLASWTATPAAAGIGAERGTGRT